MTTNKTIELVREGFANGVAPGGNLSDEEKGKAIQRDWNRYMEDN